MLLLSLLDNGCFEEIDRESLLAQESPVKVEKKSEKEVSTSTTTVVPSESRVETTTVNAAAAAPAVAREPANAEVSQLFPRH